MKCFLATWDNTGKDITFDLTDSGIVCRREGLTLSSTFQPLYSAASLQPVSHEALLRAVDISGNKVSPQDVFARATLPSDVIFLDRLCRLLHVGNFVRQTSDIGSLYLNVDGRYLMNIDDGQHGRFFEGLLGHCALPASRVVLEILESRIDDRDRLKEAVSSFSARGFRVAIDDFGSHDSNFDRLWVLSPHLVKLDRTLAVQACENPRVGRMLPKLVDIIHELGAQVVCEGIENQQQHDLAVSSGADMLQGYRYALPSPHFPVM